MAQPGFSLKLEGLDEYRARIMRIARETPQRLAAALYVRAEYVMTRSKNEFVPIDLGTLRSSGHVEKPVVRGSQITIDLVYGGAAAAYALAVHEHLSGASPRSWRNTTVTFSPPGRGPKYLEIPLTQQGSTLAQDLARDFAFE